MEESGGRLTGAGVIAGLVFCWLIIPFGPLSWLGAAFPFVLALRTWGKSWKRALFVGLANPLVVVVVAAFAVTSYFRGTASLGFHGLPGLTSYNLDRETRLPRRGGGCVVNDSEWLGDDWPNSVLKGCVALFGPMKGTPGGEYPPEVVLTGPWSDTDAEWLQIRDLRNGKITLGGQIRSVPGGAHLLDHYAPWAADDQTSPPDPLWDAEEAVKLQGKVFGGGSFAIRFGTLMFGRKPTETTILFGGEPAEVMGYFTTPGSETRSRFPPIRPGS